MRILLPLTAQLLLVLAEGSEHDWGYDKSPCRHNPQRWYLKYPDCAGRRQSPVDIVHEAITPDHTLKPLQFINYNQSLPGLVMLNDGHTMKVYLPESYDLGISSDSLPGEYRLIQFHFHWPSEHAINGDKLPLELHLVHSNQTDLVVVAVLFDFKHGRIGNMENDTKNISKANDNRTGTENAMKALVTRMKSIVHEGKNVTLTAGLKLSDLLPSDLNSYIRYSGSLTTPPCSEIAEFHIMTDKVPISRKQVNRFNSLRYEVLNAKQQQIEKKIRHNERPLQPLNGRQLRLYGDTDEQLKRNDKKK